VSSNGYLTFGREARQFFNLPLPNTAAPGLLIAPYWDDLSPHGGSVYTLLEGTAPNRRMTIQWDGFGYFGSAARATFQVTLYELDGRIVFRYLDVTDADFAKDRGASATVGIQNNTGEFAYQYAFGGGVISDGMVVEYVRDDSNVEALTWLVSGQRLTLRDPANRPTSRSLSVMSRDPGLRPPAIGSTSDPSRWGAKLRLKNPATGEEEIALLPASGWRASRNGYRYRGPGACSSVMLRKGSMRARCRGDTVSFSLQEPMQGVLAVILELGRKTAYCASFGGNVTRDSGIGFGKSGTTGQFMARDAPAPSACPITPSWM
jgi:hypothetical protein